MRQIDTMTQTSRIHPKRPGTAPRLSADSRPGHPRNAAEHAPKVTFTDWALI